VKKEKTFRGVDIAHGSDKSVEVEMKENKKGVLEVVKMRLLGGQTLFDFLKSEGVIKEQADGFCEYDQDKATKEIPAETVARWKKVKVSA
jgi:hypothetical protein